ncbi:MAG: AGE family epimerase/isomerase [Verrucomicrobiota bacterium]
MNSSTGKLGDDYAMTEQKEACRAALRTLRTGDATKMTAWLRRHLFDHVLPFWERYAMDECGGIATCIADDGTIQSGDKWMWSQWRAVWVFSRVYRTLDPDPRWLRHALHIAEFATRHAWDGTHWALLVNREGKVLRGHESIYVHAFAVYGLVELFKASGNEEHLRLARQTADSALKVLALPYEQIPHFPYPIPAGGKPQGLPMVWSFTLAELGEVTGDERYLRAARAMSAEIFEQFYRRDLDVGLEFVAQDGSLLAGPEGRVVVPGHVIENMWFQIHVSQILDTSAPRVPQACALVLRHLELGWDRVHQGLLLAVDPQGGLSDGWKFPDTKLWWPHTESLYATLLAWKETGDGRFFDWYERLWAFCLDNYVEWSHGEWRQKLNRDLSVLTGTVVLPVKDPFHLPRSLILQIELLSKA